MAFTNTPNEGVPYYKPVAPEVPVPDNTAAKIISAGTQAGISGFVQMALGAQRARLAEQEMLQRSDLAARNLEFQREELSDRHGLAVRGQDIQNRNISLDYDIANRGLEAMNEVRGSQRDLNKEKIEQMRSGMLTASQAAMEFSKSNRKIMTEANPDFIAAENPELQTKDPVGFADAVESLERQWQTAPTATGLPQRLKRLQSIANQQKSTIVLEGKNQTLSNRAILSRLRNPDTYDETYEGLKAAGHITTEEPGFDYRHPIDSIWNKYTGKGIKDVPDAFAKKALGAAKDFNPAKVQSKVGPDVPRSGPDLRAQRAALYGQGGDASSTPPPADENQTDAEIARAKLAISMGKDPAAVKAQFAKNTGLDPGEVNWEE